MADGEVFESLAIGLQEGPRACTKQLLRPRRFEQSEGSNQLRAIGPGLAGSVVFVPMLTSRV
jgi:hypothetical protein